ncbi:MAG: alpha/beta fold hydrolase [Caulobacterales bacterium]
MVSAAPSRMGLSPLAVLAAALAVCGIVAIAWLGTLRLPFAVAQLSIGDPDLPENLIVFLPGSGCEPAARQATKFFTGLTGRWKVVALEKPGVRRFQPFGCTAEFTLNADFDKLIARQTQFARGVLAAHPEAKLKVLVGYSEGGLAAPEVAAGAPGFTHLVAASAGAMDGEALVYAAGAQLSGPVKAARRMAAITQTPDAIDRFAWNDSYAYLSSLMRLRPLSAYAKLDLPILMIHGGRDAEVPLAATEIAQRAFSRAGKTNLTVSIDPRSDHRLGLDDPQKQAVLLAKMLNWMAPAPSKSAS